MYAAMTNDSRSGTSVVVPAVGAASSVTCIRSLGRRGIHTIAVSEDPKAPAFRSRYCDESIAVPSPTEDLLSYKEALLALARREDVRTIVPVREPDVYVLSRYREEFAEHVAPLWPPFEVLQDAHDRVRLVAAATDAGVSVPETQLLSEVRNWDRELIVKSRYALVTDEEAGRTAAIGDGSGQVGGARTEGSEANTEASPGGFVDVGKTRYLDPGSEPDVEGIAAAMFHDPIVQEYIPGTEYTFRALYDDGEPVVTCQKRATRGYKYARGPSVYHEATAIPELTEAGLALLDRLDWHGVASVGFIRDERTGEFKLLEINPRFWSSLPSDLPAGIDFPHYYWRVAGGEDVERNPSYETGKGTHLLRGEVAYLYSILFEDFAFVEKPPFWPELWNVARSLVTDPRFDYLSLDDPKPFAYDLLGGADSVLRPLERLTGSG
jgi:predicted ATP-grasp superfamily ATP-dependent carboligase